MRPADIIDGLAGFGRRGAGTNSERRAANWLAARVDSPSRTATIEPFWCRPNWALAHAWHAGLALVGSLLAVHSPRVGGALILIALLSTIADELLGASLGRRLTFEHASQNVIAEPGAASANRTQLIITANYDAGRMGLVYRGRLRSLAAAVRQGVRGRTLGWLGWLVLILVWLLVVAILRLEGSKGNGIGLLQLIPTVAIVLALALLLELGSADFGPAAGDNGSGTAAAVALVAALDAAPPRHATVQLVLQGASDGTALGLRRHLRARRKTLKAHNTIVLGIGPCGAGQLRWWAGDGAFVPLRYLPRLQQLCAGVADQMPDLDAAPTRTRGTTPALAARTARLPAITIGSVDERGLAPRSHQRADTPPTIDQDMIDDVVQFGLALVEQVDAFLADRAGSGRAASHATA